MCWSKLWTVIVAALLLVACQSRPDYVIDEETMTDLLTDVHMAEGLIDVQQRYVRTDDVYGQEVMAAVFEKHHVSKAQYDTSLVWYSQHLNTLIRIYKHVNSNLKDTEAEWVALADARDAFGTSPAGDSVNLWRQTPYFVMDDEMMTHFRTWSVPTDSNFLAGDTIRWSMRVCDVPVGQGVIASLALLRQDPKQSTFTIQNGASTLLLTRDTTITLTCVGVANEPTARVNATLHLFKTTPTEAALLPCVIDSLQMIRIHRKD